MPTYNIIGDIHGRDAWKRLVSEDYINIFVGDYFDPYSRIPFEALKRNFLEIIEYKKEHNDKVVLLYGNHDMDYLPCIFERNNRYDEVNAQRIQELFILNEDLFAGIAYAIGDTYLVSHAGVTNVWKSTYLPNASICPTSMAQAINDLWHTDKKPFTFKPNHYGFDYYGDDPHHSPLWVRPDSLCMNNLYQNAPTKQIVGHSKVREIAEVEGIILVDCLESVEQSYQVTLP